MTNEITQTFAFEAYDIRIIVENGEPFFCAADVCKALGYGNSREALRKHCVSEGVTKRDTPTSSGIQSMAYVNEPNLYRLITRSKMPHAVKFQDWVFEEVLPTIRKTGSYGNPMAAMLAKPKSELFLELSQISKKNEELEAANQKLIEQAEADAPKVSAYDDLVDDKGLFTATAVAKILHMKRCDLFTWFGRNQVAYQQGKDWLPYSTWEKKQWAVVKIRELDNKKTGEPITSRRLRFTAAGIFRMHKMMQAQKINVPEQLDLDI